MCGILGIVSSRHRISVLRVRSGLATMRHRGPDGEGLWERACDQPPFVMFGHRRLAIIDLSDDAAQPMVSRDGLVCLTFNGEIYNYRELRQDLLAAGQVFRSKSDTEVLLNAYRQWGADCLARLNGMFAFAIWDENRRELFAARDRFGEKPFHYVLDERTSVFAFASEIKALFAAGVVSFGLNDAAIRRFVEELVLAGDEETIYAGVRRLLPAQALRLRFDNSRFELARWTYWSVGDATSLRLSRDEASERFRELFEDSVRLRLRSDVPVGTSLSGGLDSSSVVCMIHRLGAAAGQKAFSARMEDARLDEGEHIRTIVDRTGVEAHEIVPTADELQRVFPRLCYFMEEPFPATAMFAQFLVMRLAMEHGVTVLLDGQGADEYLAGYHKYFRDRYGDLARELRFPSLFRELRAYARLRGGSRALSTMGIAGAFLPESARGMFIRWKTGDPGFRKWWNPRWLDSIPTGETDGRKLPFFGRFDARLRRDSFQGPLQELLRYGDRNSMAWSRELRQPFLDHRLAELVFSLGPESKISDGMTKSILRDSMRGLVPDAVLQRTDKLGYQAPQAEWLDGKLNVWAEAQLEKAFHELEGRMASDFPSTYRGLRRPLNEWSDSREIFLLITLGECLSQLRTVAASARGVCDGCVGSMEVAPSSL